MEYPVASEIADDGVLNDKNWAREILQTVLDRSPELFRVFITRQ